MPDNVIRFYSPSVEMGQGGLTGLTTLVAEELDTPPDRIEVKTAGPGQAYANPTQGGMQVTGGSSTITGFFVPLRQASPGANDSNAI